MLKILITQVELSAMREFKHENVCEMHCSFVAAEKLWLVMPLFTGP